MRAWQTIITSQEETRGLCGELSLEEDVGESGGVSPAPGESPDWVSNTLPYETGITAISIRLTQHHGWMET